MMDILDRRGIRGGRQVNMTEYIMHQYELLNKLINNTIYNFF